MFSVITYISLIVSGIFLGLYFISLPRRQSLYYATALAAFLLFVKLFSEGSFIKSHWAITTLNYTGLVIGFILFFAPYFSYRRTQRATNPILDTLTAKKMMWRFYFGWGCAYTLKGLLAYFAWIGYFQDLLSNHLFYYLPSTAAFLGVMWGLPRLQLPIGSGGRNQHNTLQGTQ